MTESDKTDSKVTNVLWSGQHQGTAAVKTRFAGCLLGGAVGDALGAPVEFMERNQILRRFGKDGLTRYEPVYGGFGLITDDTQMTLFTAEGLLRAWVRGCFKGITTYSGVTAHAYVRWLHTQGERSASLRQSSFKDPGWLFQQRALHSRRAPGDTCLSALREMEYFGQPARNNSKGCGGVMRVAPLGLFAWRLQHHFSPKDVFKLGTELAALTHGHPTGALAGGALAVLIFALTDGASLPDALITVKAILRTEHGHEEVLGAIERAELLAVSELPHDVAISQIGQGWVAEEALAISLYCALVAQNLEQGIVMAVNHDGDSDSTGSITGNMLGAMHGVDAIPNEWLEPLELRDVIATIAEDLFDFRDWGIGEYSGDKVLNRRIWDKYPGF